MPKKKTVKKSKAAAVPAFAVGQRVQVLTGDYGNARGDVVDATAVRVLVKLDQQPRGEPRAFAPLNLSPL